jgi:hypothetical protein
MCDSLLPGNHRQGVPAASAPHSTAQYSTACSTPVHCTAQDTAQRAFNRIRTTPSAQRWVAVTLVASTVGQCQQPVQLPAFCQHNAGSCIGCLRCCQHNASSASTWACLQASSVRTAQLVKSTCAQINGANSTPTLNVLLACAAAGRCVQEGDEYEVIPGSEFTVARTANRSAHSRLWFALQHHSTSTTTSSSCRTASQLHTVSRQLWTVGYEQQ